MCAFDCVIVIVIVIVCDCVGVFGRARVPAAPPPPARPVTNCFSSDTLVPLALFTSTPPPSSTAASIRLSPILHDVRRPTHHHSPRSPLIHTQASYRSAGHLAAHLLLPVPAPLVVDPALPRSLSSSTKNPPSQKSLAAAEPSTPPFCTLASRAHMRAYARSLDLSLPIVVQPRVWRLNQNQPHSPHSSDTAECAEWTVRVEQVHRPIRPPITRRWCPCSCPRLLEPLPLVLQLLLLLLLLLLLHPPLLASPQCCGGPPR